MSRKVIEVCKLDIKDTKKDTILSEVNHILSFRERVFYQMDLVISVKIN